MLMYVIPLIILIVVLLVVKKRQDAQGSSQPSKKGNAKNKAKKTSSTRTHSKPTKIVEDDVVETKKTQPISADTRKKIESLIQDRNFFAAEAQINQALKRDNSQHELYLLLLDVHLKQKDDFAINQLLSHLNALELHDIAQQAEAKVNQGKSSAKENDFIQFTPNHVEAVQEPVKPIAPAPLSDNAFDALISKPTFNATENVKADIEETQLDFTPSPIVETQEIDEPTIETSALEFSPSFTAKDIQPQAEVKSTVDEIKPLDFSFTLSNNDDVIEEKVSQQADVIEEAPLKTNEFDLDFSTHKFNVEETEKPSPVLDEQPDFSFNLDTQPTTDIGITATEIEKNLDSTFVEDVAPIATQAPRISENQLDNTDPLVQSFPSLIDMNEIELDLDLAQKYIELGAYDAAREILADNEIGYSAEQRQIADQLLNQIAS